MPPINSAKALVLPRLKSGNILEVSLMFFLLSCIVRPKLYKLAVTLSMHNCLLKTLTNIHLEMVEV